MSSTASTAGLLGAILLTGYSGPATAQTCTACETEIKAKLGELDTRISRTNTLIKEIDRNKLDPLVAKVDAITTKLTAVETKLDGIVALAPSAKSAVVIELANTASDYPVSTAFNSGQLKASDTLASEYCQKIGYAKGKALQVNDTPPQPNTPFATWRRELPRVVCFML
jgi:hypothetical protein